MTPDPSRLLADHLADIERIAASVCRRRGVVGDDAEDFRSWALERLIESDYAIIRKFRGDSSFRTYLVVVINNLFRDHLVRLRGRWRPSAEARRLGTLAVSLEELLHRKGRTLGEAEMELRSRGTCGLSSRQLAELAALLPDRKPLRPTRVPPVALEGQAGGQAADRAVEREEAADHREAVLTALSEAVSALAPEDQLIVRLRFLEGLTVADVARTLGLEQKPLYRRVNRLLWELRKRMEERDVTAAAVARLLEDPQPLERSETSATAGFEDVRSVQSEGAG